jgi:hypothetical protein
MFSEIDGEKGVNFCISSIVGITGVGLFTAHVVFGGSYHRPSFHFFGS